MKRENQEMGKGKMSMMEEDAGVDELLAALGYKVRSSDMADVALKLEQLEMAMGMGGAGSSAVPDDALMSHLASDTVHYNPSDLSTWLESMLSELNAPPPPLPQHHQHQLHQSYGAASSQINLFDLPPPPSTLVDAAPDSSSITTADPPPAKAAAGTRRASSDYDLKPVAGGGGGGDIVLASEIPLAEVSPNLRERKRLRTSSSSSSARSVPLPAAAEVTSAGSAVAPAPLLVDPQEAGIRLVHALMACAEAVQQENLQAADAIVKQISILAPSQGGAMRKVAAYFAEALACRIYKLHPQQDCSLDSAFFADILHMHFYESAPYLKFAHFTANQAILEAFAGCRRVHVIDFGMKQGMQWPALMQALALRPCGPPSFRLTGIGPPQPDNTDALQQVGWKLAQFADAIHVDFEYRGFVANSLADLEPYMLESPPPGPGEEPEAVAVNSVLELHRLLSRQGALEKVLDTVRAVRPRIVTVVEQEANHNAPQFMERFTEALHYYSTMFDSLEGGGEQQQQQPQDQVMSEVYLGRQICNVVACEGPERTERHETLPQWRGRMDSAGFEPVHLGSNAFKQASTLLALFAGGDGYRVEENDGCLTLGWHTRPLIATSAWRAAVAGDA